MNLPELQPSDRDLEFKERTFDEISNIIQGWLFTTNQPHRYLDKEVLGFDSKKSLGFRSMAVLHYLGLKKEFKGIFEGIEISDAIEIMKNDSQDFSDILEFLNHDKGVIKTLREKVSSKDNKFKNNLKDALAHLDQTDSPPTNSIGRNEQALLRVHLFGNQREKQCALCHKILPVNLMITAHIKPRRYCSYEERVDLNIVMPACKIGCDDLFEKGYLIVGKKGLIQKHPINSYSKELDIFMNQYDGKKYDGKKCTFYNKLTKKYFDAKYRMLEKNSKKNAYEPLYI